MIHDIRLPNLTEQCLLSLVQLQMSLLEYAACVPAINSEQKGYTECEEYLNRDSSFFKGHGQQIAKELWHRHKSGEEPIRIKLLQAFNESFTRSDDSRSEFNDLDFKQSWLERIRKELKSLAYFDGDKIEIGYFYGNGKKYIQSKRAKNQSEEVEAAPVWQQKAGEFFLYFYKAYLEDSDDGFPATFFPPDIAALLSRRKQFGRQELLSSFLTENSNLHICPICDENGYYTDSRGKIRATIDHFLPKDVYPHFACHPHNLVPTCYGCNSNVKGTRDPLHALWKEPGPGYLYKEARPYVEEIKRKDNFYLTVDLSKGLREIRFSNLQYNSQLEGVNKEGLNSALDILERLYDIPGRWATGDRNRENKVQEDSPFVESQPSAKKKSKPSDASTETEKPVLAADRISETLFRRMRQFLGQGKDMMSADHMLEELSNALSLLLYYLSEEDRYKDPLTIPMLWILAAFLSQENQQLSLISKLQEAEILPKNRQFIPAGLDEVLSWSGQDSAEIEHRANTIQTILNLMINRNDH